MPHGLGCQNIKLCEIFHFRDKQQESSAAKHRGMIEGFAMRLQTLAAKEPQKFYEQIMH